jgi:DNA-binding NtrC family response regulator
MSIKDLVAKAVMIVDDEPLVLAMLVRAARSWHFEIQSASTAEGALLALERRCPPIVVTDLSMPSHGGVWLVGKFAGAGPRSPSSSSQGAKKQTRPWNV